LGFLGWPLFRLENPAEEGLDFVGLPWILSCESSLFNGLCGIFGELNFARPWPVGSGAGMGSAAVDGGRISRIIHQSNLAQFLFFVNRRSSDQETAAQTISPYNPDKRGETIHTMSRAFSSGLPRLGGAESVPLLPYGVGPREPKWRPRRQFPRNYCTRM
jgi:hypothetical protein